MNILTAQYRQFLIVLAIAALTPFLSNKLTGNEPAKPNIIYVMIDDAGYGDFGATGSKHIQTPSFDRMCREGTLFTNHYSGSAVCAPTRCVLMTGLHTGHCRRRDNQAKANRDQTDERGLVFLKKNDVTIAESMKQAGYITGGIGKWGLGNPGSEGTPDRQGFDHFYGYLDQVHAHDHYTDWLWRNGERHETQGRYSHDLFEQDSLEFIRKNRSKPFFLYLPYCLPHGKYVIPDSDPAARLYKDKPWSQTVKNYAAMVTRSDRTVGRIIDLLEELELDSNTILFFTSDNGPNTPFLKDLNSNGPFRGIKRTLNEGGIRAAMAVRWPGKVPAGKTSQYLWGMRDMFPTCCDLAGVQPPQNLDGISVLPTLLGKTQPEREAMYWEFPKNSQQAVRMGKWKGIRLGTHAKLSLYDLSSDPQEQNDLAETHPDIVNRIEAVMKREHVDSKFWPLQKIAKPNGKKSPRSEK